MKIAIVGSGFSGASLLWHFAHTSNASENTYYIIDRNSDFGKGEPYTHFHAPFYMNVPSKRLSISPDEPLHFFEWLKRKGVEDDFVHRSIFGEYLSLCLQEAVKKLKKVIFVQSEAISLRHSDSHFLLQTSSDLIEADYVVVASGPVYSPPPEAARFFADELPFFENPWAYVRSQKKLERVLILGSGLTACDVACYCVAQGAKKVTLFSRHGLLPHKHELDSRAVAPDLPVENFLNTPGLAAKTHFIRNFCSQPNVPWQICFDQLRPHIPRIWKSLDKKEKSRFLRHLKTFWNIHRHRLPVPTEKILKKALAEDKIQVVKGALDGSRQDRFLKADVVINATGVSADPSRQPFLNQLTQSKLIVSDSFGLGFRSLHSQLFTLGCARMGEDWEATAARELAIQASELAKNLARKLNKAA